MVDSKENYKFDLGVKGLNVPYKYGITIFNIQILHFHCFVKEIIFIVRQDKVEVILELCRSFSATW